ncbi:MULTISPECIES: carbohydrate kinase family protein [Mycolicibacterium]|uniref:Adenosine kinase n=1 Tax=Mycolicibacterium senegalense TaxID=1796 RepID=A0A378W8B3_9MYCO|nr:MULTISPECIES: carbohydrate kinase family protein [Mycolicibacterium]MCV7336068.1 carbohydrate kinase family protein [Mycolicibacterium senegalense]MDR7287926.1 adenosine kinase [Mycolicibacterium senegalense]QZA24929.1 carbohydrate kinase family protein [Mycolicibacterium senegalense]CDP86664.1 adenosine kinase CbhK [Mycolicibacterium farcinogenes]SUA28498.1 adenosine kinase [Mycolicibacterium senegalense]
MSATIIVTGSIATDHLMHFAGRFAEQFIDTHLDRLSLSFLVDDLTLRRGGVGANIAFGMGVLGRKPLLVGAVGSDFDDYRAWLENHGVDCSALYVSQTAHTARFMCTTDDDQCQLASFYPGAMAEASSLSLEPLTKSRAFDLVLVGANDPAAMLAHTADARRLGVPFAADPSQQLPMLDRDAARALVDGARYLFTNEYEWELLARRTEWSEADIAARVGLRVTTLSSKGCLLVDSDGSRLHVGVVPAREIVDPTGVGDAFRAGFLSGIGSDLDYESAAQLGSLIATLVLETAGAQEWQLDLDDAAVRLADAYGAAAESAIMPVLRGAMEMETS